MFDWIVKNKFVVIFTIAGMIVGYFISRYANKISEDRIINAFKEELKKLK